MSAPTAEQFTAPILAADRSNEWDVKSAIAMMLVGETCSAEEVVATVKVRLRNGEVREVTVGARP